MVGAGFAMATRSDELSLPPAWGVAGFTRRPVVLAAIARGELTAAPAAGRRGAAFEAIRAGHQLGRDAQEEAGRGALLGRAAPLAARLSVDQVQALLGARHAHVGQ